MITLTYSFTGYPASKQVRFTCEVCHKPNRTRTFTHKCTVNPYNVDELGYVLGPAQVRKQSQERAERDARGFMQYPVCAKCLANMTYAERKAVGEKQRLPVDN